MAIALAIAGGLVAGGKARAQVAGDDILVNDGCALASTVEFDLGTTNLDLDAESNLSKAANWATLEPGRYIKILGSTTGRSNEARLGPARAASAATYVWRAGVDYRLVTIGSLSELQPADQYAYIKEGTVAILTCDGYPVP